MRSSSPCWRDRADTWPSRRTYLMASAVISRCARRRVCAIQPFVGWAEVGRFDRDGKSWVRLRQTSVDWCVDVEVLDLGLGDVVPVDPPTAYQLALEADGHRPDPVIYE
jgi:hypothetical protein